MNTLAEAVVSKPFKHRKLNYGLHLLWMILFTSLTAWARLSHFGVVKRDLTMEDVTLTPLSAFLMSATTSLLLQMPSRKKPEWPKLNEADAAILASQLASLRELRDGARLQWLASVIVTHGAVFGFLGWVLEKHVNAKVFPWSYLMTISYTSLALISWSAVAALVESDYRLQVASEFLQHSGNPTLEQFFRKMDRRLPWNLVLAFVSAVLVGVAGMWTIEASLHWFSLLQGT